MLISEQVLESKCVPSTSLHHQGTSNVCLIYRHFWCR